MSNKIKEIYNDIERVFEEKSIYDTSNYNDSNVTTGDKNHLYTKLKQSFKNATSIDIVVSFLMESGVKMILEDLKEALNRGVNIRILTGNYLKITQPQALYLLKSELKDKVDLRFYNNPSKSFHPKSYMFHNPLDSEIYVGSSNISRGALTSSIEWNYKFLKSNNPKDFQEFYNTFVDLFNNHSVEITDEVLKDYSKNWTRPNVYKDVQAENSEEIEDNIINLYEPRGAQIEALYTLEKSREEGFDKGLVVAATGIGKTYLAAFDSRNYKRVLFVAHREEIINQAAQSFKNVRNTNNIGFFYGEKKDTTNDFVFALVQTLGKDMYLDEKYFAKDYFDYIVVDEFHHAVSNNYKKIIDYFEPKFLLGLTATPERLDSKDVFALCDYNMVYEVRLKDAINKGWLVPFNYYGIYDESVNYEDIEYKNGKYNDKQLEEALMLNKRAELVLNHYLKYNSERAIGFCSSRHHAEYMAKIFNENNIPSVAVYSGEGGEYSENRTIALNKLTSGEIKIIFSVDMFNEGLDVPAIDMVLFLRPTQSPTIFLQQLGRGLRIFKDKKYLNVLDFIGNYKKANLIPFLLSGKEYSASESKNNKQGDYEIPNDCNIDFDFRIIDIFKKQAESEMKVKDKIKEQYDIVKSLVGHTPSRVELFTYMEEQVYDLMKSKGKSMNLFLDYMEYVKENDILDEEELKLYNSLGREFINMIETTSMSKTYKMPILLAFYNDGNIKMEITEDDIYKSFYEFYKKGSNKVDMLKDKGTKDFEKWKKKDYIALARKNPIKFLTKTHGDFFREDENSNMVICNELKDIIKNEAFKKHMKDAIELRVETYYKSRFLDKK